MEETQEAKDEAEVVIKYTADMSAGIDRERERQNYEKSRGIKLRHCYVALLRRLQANQVSPTEVIE